MGKYRKKPAVIEVVEWTGKNLAEVIAFTGLYKSARHLSGAAYAKLVQEEGLKIFTLEGPLKATIGDFIIKDVRGEFYSCKPDIFNVTYEKVE